MSSMLMSQVLAFNKIQLAIKTFVLPHFDPSYSLLICKIYRLHIQLVRAKAGSNQSGNSQNRELK